MADLSSVDFAAITRVADVHLSVESDSGSVSYMGGGMVGGGAARPLREGEVPELDGREFTLRNAGWVRMSSMGHSSQIAAHTFAKLAPHIVGVVKKVGKVYPVGVICIEDPTASRLPIMHKDGEGTHTTNFIEQIAMSDRQAFVHDCPTCRLITINVSGAHG